MTVQDIKEKAKREYGIDHKRFTPKFDGIIYSEDFQTQCICEKCKALEDLEDKIGIEIEELFDTLFFKQDFYFKSFGMGKNISRIQDDYYVVHILLDRTFDILLNGETIGNYKFEDYGKTWGKKEDIEETAGGDENAL